MTSKKAPDNQDKGWELVKLFKMVVYLILVMLKVLVASIQLALQVLALTVALICQEITQRQSKEKRWETIKVCY